VLGGLGSTVGGAYLGNGIQTGDVFGGLTGLGNGGKRNKNSADPVELCKTRADAVKTAIGKKNVDEAKQYLLYAKSFAEQAKAPKEAIDNAQSKLDAWVNATSDNEKKEAAEAAMDLLKVACEQGDTTNSNSNDKNKKWIGSTVGAAVVGTAGTLMVNKIIKDIQQSNLDKEQKAAYDEWMNSVGKHIHCYIGADEVADFGEVIQTSME